MAQKTFRELTVDIKKGVFAPIYILQGEEEYYIDKLTDALEEHVVPPDSRDFNVTVRYGNDVDLKELMGACRQFPFMADHRLVVLREAQSMQRCKIQLEQIADYAKNPSQQNVLVIVIKGDTLGATSKLLKNAQKANGIVFTSKALRDYEMATPIKDYLRTKKMGIEEKALALLVEFLGTSLTKIFREIDKLIVALNGKSTQITCDDIEKNIGISKEYNHFELTDALAHRDYTKAMRIVHYFRTSKAETVMTTGTLFSFFSKVVMGHASRDKSEAGLMKAMELKSSWQLKNYRPALQNFTPMQSIRAISLLREYDTKSKGIESYQDPYSLLEELVFNLFTIPR